ncbi:methionine/alanine import family NSS transporter small subunit [Agilicoccus flavus]|nr:methionine/alanine import family NSS transporter small subunit [Agilicoccus flavus]
MSATAIVMMICYLGIVWGGLVLALLHLRKHPDE